MVRTGTRTSVLHAHQLLQVHSQLACVCKNFQHIFSMPPHPSLAMHVPDISHLVLFCLPLQDRWFALSGSGGAEVRLRMTLLPGTLPSSSSSSSSGMSGSAVSAAAAGSGGSSPSSSNSSSEVSDMLSFFHKNLLGSSRESVMVEVSPVLHRSSFLKPCYLLQQCQQLSLLLACLRRASQELHKPSRARLARYCCMQYVLLLACLTLAADTLAAAVVQLST
jgi:hypothetical protein